MKLPRRSLPLVAALALVAAIPLARASEESFSRLVQRWKMEREQLMKKMTQAWLRGEKPQALKGDLLALSQIESGLATSPGIVLYIASADDPGDITGSVGAVVRAWLRQRGASVDSADFLRGKSFNVIERDEYGTPSPVSRVRRVPAASEESGALAPEEGTVEIRRTERRIGTATAYGD